MITILLSNVCRIYDIVSYLNLWDEAWIRIGDPRELNKGRSSKFRRVRQAPEEGWRTYRPKHHWNNNKDKDNSLKTLNDIVS